MPQLLHYIIIMYEAVLALLLLNASPKAVPPKALAKAIVLISERHQVDPLLVTRIILVESRGVPGAYNPLSHDHGLMQINEVHKIDMVCLYNWRCNLRQGIKILAQLKNLRPCAYNLGAYGSQRPARYAACISYEQRLEALND